MRVQKLSLWPEDICGARGCAMCDVGMPIGIQLMGRPWCEASLLYAGSVLESAIRPLIKMPAVTYDLLSGEPS